VNPRSQSSSREASAIYIPGEIGVRLEDIITITPDGAENLTNWSGSPEEPAIV
jgi:Xaa-Pro aminopeptidase